MLENTRFRHYIGNIKRFITIPVEQEEISVSEAANIFGCSFSKDGWHYIIETLKQYDLDNKISYKDTTLYRYLKNFCPANILEVAGIERGSGNIPVFCYPWGVSFRIAESGDKDVWQSRFCGPSTDEFIEEEFHRIIDLYAKLKSTGYRPWSFGNGFIGGTFLGNKSGARRFVVLQGNHRMAILAHLGLKKIKVRYISGCFSNIVETESMNWVFVRNGQFDNEDALKIFNMFFEQKGFHIKRIIENSSAGSLKNEQ